MQTANDKRTGDQVVTDDFAFHGMVVGNVSVIAPGRLWLHGYVVGSVHVGPGGTAYIHGVVDHVVVNDGGLIEVFGTVGAVQGSPVPKLAPEAIVKGLT